MEFDLLVALFAGLMATVTMTLVLEGLTLKGATSMPSMSFVLGSAFSGDHEVAMLVGNLLHFVVLGTLVSGVGYALVMSLLPISPWVMGLGLGLVQGTLVGVALGNAQRVHPRMVDQGASRPGRRAILTRGADRAEVVSTTPGMFGVNWGDTTPIVLMAAYATYGLVFALIYSALS